MRTVARHALDRAIIPKLRAMRAGTLLEIGPGSRAYGRLVSCQDYVTCDLHPRDGIDVVSDAHALPFADESLELVVATEVLEHLKEPEVFVSEVHRILRKGGAAVFSTRFLYPYHPSPADYWRFTKDSLEFLFRAFSSALITPLGNRIQVIWDLIQLGPVSLALSVLNPIIARLNISDGSPSGFMVIVRKS